MPLSNPATPGILEAAAVKIRELEQRGLPVIVETMPYVTNGAGASRQSLTRNELVRAVCAVNPRTVVVLVTGS